MNNKGRIVGVFFGGPSEEYEISCRSACNIVQGLLELGCQVVPIGISRSGRWYGPVRQEDILNFTETNYVDNEIILLPKPGGQVYALPNMEIVCELEVVFPIIHGKYGEDGRLQGLLDMCRLPYVGPGVGGSVVGMDKVYMRDILKAHGIEQADYVAILRSEWLNQPESSLLKVEKKLGYPVFVKPANGGSSVGINQAADRDSLRAAFDEACKYDRKIIVEQAIDKREIEVAVLGNDHIYLSSPGEILSDQAFYDYRAKYRSKESRTEVPAQLSDKLIESIWRIGGEVYRALDLAGLCRVDFFLEKGTNKLLLNEVNTLPGFTEISMYAQMWAVSHKNLPMLLDELISLAIEKEKELAQNIKNIGG